MTKTDIQGSKDDQLTKENISHSAEQTLQPRKVEMLALIFIMVTNKSTPMETLEVARIGSKGVQNKNLHTPMGAKTDQDVITPNLTPNQIRVNIKGGRRVMVPK